MVQLNTILEKNTSTISRKVFSEIFIQMVSALSLISESHPNVELLTGTHKIFATIEIFQLNR